MKQQESINHYKHNTQYRYKYLFKRPMGHIALRKHFKFHLCIFQFFVIISSWKRVGPFIWTNLNTLYPMMLCVKFLRNWPSGSGGEDFLNVVNVFLLFHNYLPLEKGVNLHLNKLEFPLPKNALCQVWLKLAKWFWRRRRNCGKFTDR